MYLWKKMIYDPFSFSFFHLHRSSLIALFFLITGMCSLSVENPFPDQTVSFNVSFAIAIASSDVFDVAIGLSSSHSLAISDTTSWMNPNLGSSIDCGLVSEVDTSNPVPYYGPLGVFVYDDYAYVADSIYGMKIIDVSTKSSPILVGSLFLYDCQSIFVSGDYAYVADSIAGLTIVDISNKAYPFWVGSLVTYFANEIFVSGDYVYVADGYLGFKIINVTNKTNPILVGSMDTYEAQGIYVSGDYTYIADGLAGLKIFDVSDKANPELVGFVDTYDAEDVFVEGEYAYIADGAGGLLIYDVSNKIFPFLTGYYYSLTLTYWAMSVVVSEGYAFLGEGYDYLKIIDVSDKYNPFLVGSLDTDDVDDYVWDVVVYEDHVFLGCVWPGWEGLRIYEIFHVETVTLSGVCNESGSYPLQAVCTEDEIVATDNFTVFCDCNNSWTGSDCSNCSLVCENGGIQSSDCSACICIGGYTDEICSTCPLECQNEGYHDINCTYCVCEQEDVSGSLCDYYYCFGILFNETYTHDNITNTTYIPAESVCSGHGSCIAKDTCECDAEYDYTEDCYHWKCDNIFFNDTEHVCTGHGNCTEPETCVCHNNETNIMYNGTYCEEWDCFEKANTAADVCYIKDIRGTCVDWNHCECNEGFGGQSCELFICWDLEQSDVENVCDGHGSCDAPDVCNCRDDYENEFPNGPCSTWKCDGIQFDSTDEDLCSGNGNCTAPGICVCNLGYEGNFCDMWNCGAYSKDSEKNCNEKGTCISPDFCDCTAALDDEYYGHFGDLCELKLGKNFVLATRTMMVVYLEIKTEYLSSYGLPNVDNEEEKGISFQCSSIFQVSQQQDSNPYNGELLDDLFRNCTLSRRDDSVEYVGSTSYLKIDISHLLMITVKEIMEVYDVNLNIIVLEKYEFTINLVPTLVDRDFDDEYYTMKSFSSITVEEDNLAVPQEETEVCKRRLLLENQCIHIYDCVEQLYDDDTSDAANSVFTWYKVGYYPSTTSGDFFYTKIYFSSSTACEEGVDFEYTKKFSLVSCYGGEEGDNFAMYAYCGSQVADMFFQSRVISIFSLAMMPVYIMIILIFCFCVCCQVNRYIFCAKNFKKIKRTWEKRIEFIKKIIVKQQQQQQQQEEEEEEEEDLEDGLETEMVEKKQPEVLVVDGSEIMFQQQQQQQTNGELEIEEDLFSSSSTDSTTDINDNNNDVFEITDFGHVGDELMDEKDSSQLKEDSDDFLNDNVIRIDGIDDDESNNNNNNNNKISSDNGHVGVVEEEEEGGEEKSFSSSSSSDEDDDDDVKKTVMHFGGVEDDEEEEDEEVISITENDSFENECRNLAQYLEDNNMKHLLEDQQKFQFFMNKVKEEEQKDEEEEEEDPEKQVKDIVISEKKNCFQEICESTLCKRLMCCFKTNSCADKFLKCCFLITMILVKEGVYLWFASSEFLSDADVDTQNPDYILVVSVMGLCQYFIWISIFIYLVVLLTFIIGYIRSFLLDPLICCVGYGSLKEYVYFRIVKCAFLIWFFSINLFCYITKYIFLDELERRSQLTDPNFYLNIMIPEFLLIFCFFGVLGYNGVSSHAHFRRLKKMGIRKWNNSFPQLKIGFTKCVKDVDMILEEIFQLLYILDDRDVDKGKSLMDKMKKSEEYGLLRWEYISGLEYEEILVLKKFFFPRGRDGLGDLEGDTKANSLDIEEDYLTIFNHYRMLSLKWVVNFFLYPIVCWKAKKRKIFSEGSLRRGFTI